MRKLLLLLLLLPACLFAQSSHATGDSTAIILHESQAPGSDLIQKLDELVMLETSGIKNADLYYNIGVYHYKLNHVALAKLYFLRALNLNSAHRGAAHNLSFIRELSPDRELYPPKQFLQTVFYRVYDWFNLNRSSLAALLFLVLSALCLHWLLHYDPSKERALPTLILLISLLFLASFTALTITKAYRMTHNRKAIVREDGTPLYTDPSFDAPGERSVNAALMVIVSEVQAEHTRVILPDGSSAWIESSALLKVSP